MPILVWEFYKSYGKDIPNCKSRLKRTLKTLDVVEVKGVQVPFSEAEINDILGCAFQSKSYLKYLMQLKTFKDINEWLSSLIVIQAPLWLEEGVIIEKRNEHSSMVLVLVYQQQLDTSTE